MKKVEMKTVEMKKVVGKTYSFRVPTKEYEKLQKKVNVIAAEEGLQVWEVIAKAVENYKLKGEKR